MWKKVCCAALVSVSRQVEELRSVKAAFFRGQSGPGNISGSHDVQGGGGPCAVGAISRPSNCSRGDAVHLWEATYVRKCLGSRAPGDLTCTLKCPAWKNRRDVPGLLVLTHSALLYNFSCGTRCRPLTLSRSVSLAPSPVSFLFPFYQFFQPNFFPLYLSSSPRPIHHQTLTSICCLPGTSSLVIVFLLGLAGLYSQMVCSLLTNVSGSLASITAVQQDGGLNEIPKAKISHFLTHYVRYLRDCL